MRLFYHSQGVAVPLFAPPPSSWGGKYKARQDYVRGLGRRGRREANDRKRSVPQASVKPAFSFTHQTTHRYKHTKNLKHASSAQFERGTSEAAKHRSPPLCIRVPRCTGPKSHTQTEAHTHTQKALASLHLLPAPSAAWGSHGCRVLVNERSC